mmetsp:Transcript_12924/g.19435  ORF Transcript_12924/g.19435 Transcript_12924/m.19435 type:complete len:410 (+) Transcript_12924:112-1341(+)
MGGSYSINRLNTQQQSELTRTLRIEYENCCKQSYSPAAQQEHLTAKYEHLLNRFSTEMGHMHTRRSKEEADMATIGRRRSFNNSKRSLSRGKSSVALSRCLSSAELDDDIIEEPTPDVDTWDSVADQPSCMICSRIFPTAEKLKDHEEHSVEHQENLNRMKNKKKSISCATRCKLYYTGKKFFIDTNDSMEIHIYSHNKKNCVEVIAFEGTAQTELPRIYLNEEALLKYVGRDIIFHRIDEELNNMSVRVLKRFKGAMPSREMLFDEEKRILLSTHIIGNLKVSISQASTGLALKNIVYSPSEPNNTLMSLSYPSKPKNVKAAKVSRRRHSTEQELKDAARGLSAMQKYVRQTTGKSTNARTQKFCTSSASTPPFQPTSKVVSDLSLRTSIDANTISIDTPIAHVSCPS